MITSPHNETLTQVRKLAGRKWRDKTREFVAEGEDLIEAAEAAGWGRAAAGAADSGLDGRGGRAAAAREGLAARLGHARAGRLPAALGAGAGRAAVRGAVGRGRSRQRRHRAALGARLRRRQRRARAGQRRPVRAQGGARLDGRDLLGARRARARGRRAARAAVALARRRGAPLTELADREVTLVVGAEREGLPDAVLAACDEVGHIPIRSESLNAAMAATVAMYEVSR